MQSQLKNLLIITIGCLFLSASIVVFFAPNQIVTGGPPGIGIILLYLLGIPVGLTVFLINFSLMLLGGKRYGRGYFLRTLYAVAASSAFIEILVYLFPDPALFDKPYLNVLFGSVLIGIGLAMCFTGKASSGGLATAAQLIAERLNIGIGRVIQLIDGSIVLLSALIFHNFVSALWAGLGVLITGFIVDRYMRWQSKLAMP
ncbi:MAG: YitT family protein [Alcaligenaceae bacterium]|nr:YitT family protein [Alcaligenaceae bacterium]